MLTMIAVLNPLVATHLSWNRWATLIQANGLTVDRPAYHAHPDYPDIIYPMDYGYVNGTIGSDGEPVDCFIGRHASGLVAAILTHDHRKGDREVKLLYNCSPPEIYTAHGFINYDRSLLEGVLAMRRPMHALWDDWTPESPPANGVTAPEAE